MWVALAGGVGGAKLARGLAANTPTVSAELCVVVNTGDDFTQHGLHISPDLDTVLYTLAGIANPATGWGITDDTFATLDQLKQLGADTWFWLGDRDLATHIARTAAMHAGESLTAIMRRFALALGIPAQVQIIPMSDDPVATKVATPDGWLDFQDYFVRRQHRDPVQAVRFDGIAQARPQPQALAALRAADAIIICPSNPIVSIGPLLAMEEMRQALATSTAPRVAVSPIIGGRALKGPADQMLAGLGYAVSALGVARLYQGLVDIFVLDDQDAALAPAVAALGLQPLVTNTIMQSPADSQSLATTIAQAVRDRV